MNTKHTNKLFAETVENHKIDDLLKYVRTVRDVVDKDAVRTILREAGAFEAEINEALGEWKENGNG